MAGHRVRALEAPITKQAEFQFRISLQMKVCLESPLHPGSHLQDSWPLSAAKPLQFVTELDGNRNLSHRMSKIEILYCFTALLTMDRHLQRVSYFKPK